MTDSLSSRILTAVKLNDVTSLEDLIRSISRDRYSAATFTLPLPPTVSKLLLPTDQVSLMHISAYFDTLDCFLYLENKNLLYNQESAGSYLPIHYACLNGSYEVICYILSKDPKQASLLQPVTYHQLYLATFSGDSDILSLLFENGADLSQPQNLENKPIALAIKSRHVDCLRLLLQHNLSKSKIDAREYSTLMLAIANNEKDAVPMLLESGEDPAFVTTTRYESALFLACFFGKEWLNVIKMICEKTTKLDLDYTVTGVKMAIHWACGSKSPEIVELLLQTGQVDPTRLDGNEKTGLFYLVDAAPEADIIRILEMMVARGLVISQHPTIIADFITAIRRPISVIEWLFKHGADPQSHCDGWVIGELVKAYQASPPMKRLYETYCVKSKSK